MIESAMTEPTMKKNFVCVCVHKLLSLCFKKGNIFTNNNFPCFLAVLMFYLKWCIERLS